MKENLSNFKKVSRKFKATCLALAALITLQTVKLPAKADAETESATYLKKIDVTATVDANSQWGNTTTEIGKKIKAAADIIAGEGYENRYKSEEDALIIKNEIDLAAFAYCVNGGKGFSNKYVKLAADIDLEGKELGISKTPGMGEDSDKFTLTYSGEVKNAWTPIGSNSNSLFAGTFDGCGHEIKGMIVLNETNAGLFGCVAGANIKNVGIGEGSYVISNTSNNNSYAGGLVGYVASGNSVTIENCYMKGEVASSSSSSEANAGGLVGNGSTVIIKDSYVAGPVYSYCENSKANAAGGLVGYSKEVVIENSYVAPSSSTEASTLPASVSACGKGDTNAGGLVGYIDSTSVTIENSYVAEPVSACGKGDTNAGGLVGYVSVMYADNKKITRSYVTESVYAKNDSGVEGSAAYAGGLVGNNSNADVTIRNSYAAKNTGLVGNGHKTLTNSCVFKNNETDLQSLNKDDQDKPASYYIAWNNHTPTFAAGRTSVSEDTTEEQNLLYLLQNQANTNGTYAAWMIKGGNLRHFCADNVEINVPTDPKLTFETVEMTATIENCEMAFGKEVEISCNTTELTIVKEDETAATEGVFEKEKVTAIQDPEDNGKIKLTYKYYFSEPETYKVKSSPDALEEKTITVGDFQGIDVNGITNKNFLNLTENADYINKKNEINAKFQDNPSGCYTTEPLTISNAAELAVFADYVNACNNFSNKYVKLTADIDLGGTGVTRSYESNKIKYSVTNVQNVWTPIGSSNNSFQGTFDGCGHEIKGMVVLNDANAGLFGYVEGATIRNVGIGKGSYVISNNANIGGLVGYINTGKNVTIENCYMKGEVASFSSKANAGGLVGNSISSITINNSYAAGAVYSYSFNDTASAGGLVGSSSNVGINNSYVTGPVYSFSTNTAYAGGLVGNSSSSVTINNNYVAGPVYSNSNSANAYAGGLVGYNNGGTIQTSYVTKPVAAKASNSAYVGGIVGRDANNNGVNVNRCYVSGLVYGKDGTVKSGGIIGHCESITVKHSYWRSENNLSCYGDGNLDSNSIRYSPKSYTEMTKQDFASALDKDDQENLSYISWPGHTPTFAAGRTSVSEDTTEEQNLLYLLQKQANNNTTTTYADWMIKEGDLRHFCADSAEVQIDSSGSNLTVFQTIDIKATMSYAEEVADTNKISKKLEAMQLIIKKQDPQNTSTYNPTQAGTQEGNVTANPNGNTGTLTYKYYFSEAGTYRVKCPDAVDWKEIVVEKAALIIEEGKENVSVSVNSGYNLVCNGQSKKPSVTVKVNEKVLPQNYYSVAYGGNDPNNKDNIDIGKATATVTIPANDKVFTNSDPTVVPFSFTISGMTVDPNMYLAASSVGKTKSLEVTKNGDYSLSVDCSGEYKDSIEISPPVGGWSTGDKAIFFIKSTSGKTKGQIGMKELVAGKVGDEKKDFTIITAPECDIKVGDASWIWPEKEADQEGGLEGDGSSEVYWKFFEVKENGSKISIEVTPYDGMAINKVEYAFINVTDDNVSDEYVSNQKEIIKDTIDKIIESVKADDNQWNECAKVAGENMYEIENVTQFGAKIVCLRVTYDGSEVTYGNSKGIIVYKKPDLPKDGKYDYIIGSSKDLRVPINFNGNTVEKITCNDGSTNDIGRNKKYRVSGSAIIFDSEYLDKLNTDSLKVTLQPQGKRFLKNGLSLPITISINAMVRYTKGFGDLTIPVGEDVDRVITSEDVNLTDTRNASIDSNRNLTIISNFLQSCQNSLGLSLMKGSQTIKTITIVLNSATEDTTTSEPLINANNWGHSDIRAYLNNGYAGHFSEKELNLVQPWTYDTDVLDNDGNPVDDNTYDLTDRFLLPSGNKSHRYAVSWDGADLRPAENNGFAARLIPSAYWPFANVPLDVTNPDKKNVALSWLRSPCCNYSHSLVTHYGYETMDYGIKNTNPYVAAMFKIDLGKEESIGEVIFASAASAANLINLIKLENSSTLTKITGEDFNDYGRRTTVKIPNYGMYLKTTKGDVKFTLNYNERNTSITITAMGSTSKYLNWYIVVHAFKENDLISYATAKQFKSNVGIDISTLSLNGYTFKIWLENPDGPASLAEATKPDTHVFNSNVFEKTTRGAKNPRVFADKNELQCSWGDLSNLSKKNYESKVDACEPITGIGATNQKIYFGSKDGAPLQFWIAGRETETGEPDPNGNIMCLYQAEAVDQMAFKKD